jgi:hypothetical protein
LFRSLFRSAQQFQDLLLLIACRFGGIIILILALVEPKAQSVIFCERKSACDLCEPDIDYFAAQFERVQPPGAFYLPRLATPSLAWPACRV